MTDESHQADGFESWVFDFERAWSQSPRPRIEDSLPPDEPLRSRVLAELILIDVDRRTRAGEVVAVEDYLVRFPELASNTEFADQFRQLVAERRQRSWVISNGTVRYRVIGFHAQGGLGQVSMAVDEELKRTVALKEMQSRFVEHPGSRQRFLREAEITGGLEHPGIVPVYGLGTFSDGRPYYAMRFIDGTSLKDAITALHATTPGLKDAGTEFVLEFRRLLGHFITVCDAVQYAHDRGVLHRDLKPSNIMLGKYGETFVVDWGLAKAEDGTEISDAEPAVVPTDRPSDQQPTAAGDKLGTLDYMSPEQAAGRHEEVGTASDVYGLGATLYHLLTGVPAFTSRATDSNLPNTGSPEGVSPRTMGQSCASVVRGLTPSGSPKQFCDEMPPLDKLARRVQSGDFPAPRTVAPSVPRALEAVCLKAMALRPADRYGSAQELASDIERWLADEAVTALPDSLAERCGRWARRHRTLVAAMLGLLLTAVIALAIGTVLLNRERKRTVEERNQADASDRRAQEQQRKAEQNEATAIAEANRATEQARRAAQKAAEVEQISNFLVNLFRTADPLSLRGLGFGYGIRAETNLTAKEMLQRGRQRIEDLKEQPLVQAKLLENLGDVYRDLGDYESAKELLDRAWELRQSLLPPDDPAIAETALSLGRWHQDQGHFREAKEFYDQALSTRLKHWSEESLPVAEVQFHQAWLLSDRDRQAPAAELFRRVLRTREKLLGPNHPETRTAKVFLAMNLLAEGREMEGMLHMASDLELAAIPQGILDYRTAESLRMQGRYDEARAKFESLVEHTTEALGKQHPIRALLLGSVAGVAQQQGKFADARQLTEEAMAVLQPLVRNHSRMARPAAQYARGLAYGGYLPRAEKYLRHALKLAQAGVDADVGSMQGETHESTIALGRVLLEQGKYDGVRDLYDQGYPLSGKWKNYQFRADCVRLLGQSLVAQGNPERAAPSLGDACRITGSLGDRLELSDLLEHAECLREAGQDELAEAQAAKALRLADQWDRDDASNAFTLTRMAHVYSLHDRVDDAEKQFRKAAKHEPQRLLHPHVADQCVLLARFLALTGKLDEADQLLAQAERDLVINVGSQELPTTAARLERARVQQRRGNVTHAVDLARSVLADRTQLLGADHPAVAEAQWTLAEFLSPSIEASRAEALALLASAHANTRARFGSGHPRTFEIVERRADMLRATGAFDEAIQLLDIALNEAPSTMPRGTSTSIARLVSVRGAIATDRQDYSAAESLLKSSHHRLQITFGRLDERTQRSLRRLVRLYEAWNKPDAATEYRRQLLP